MPAKNFVLLLCLATLCGCSHVSEPPPIEPTGENAEVFFFLADGTPEELRLELWPMVYERLVREANPGDVFHFVSCGDVHAPVATVRIPPGVRQVREHQRSMKRELASPSAWFHASPTASSLQLNIPEVPSTVQSLRATDYPCSVVLVGDPCYESRYHDGWSFRGHFVPTDDCAVISKSSKSPFNSGVVNLPEGTVVTLLTPNAEFGVDHIFRQAVSDFWTLFFQERGGKLLRITASPGSALNLDPSSAPSSVVANLTGKQRMVQASVRTVGTVVPAGIKAFSKPGKYKRAESTSESLKKMFAEAVADKEHTSFFLRWTADDDERTLVDVDISVVDRSTGEEAFYDVPYTSHATMGTDMRHGEGTPRSGRFGDNYESVVVFNDGDNDYWLNFFNGYGKVDVEVIQVRHGLVTWKVFEYENVAGDGRKNGYRRTNHPAWHRLPLPLADASTGPRFDETTKPVTPLPVPPESLWSALSDVDKLLRLTSSPPERHL